MIKELKQNVNHNGIKASVFYSDDYECFDVTVNDQEIAKIHQTTWKKSQLSSFFPSKARCFEVIEIADNSPILTATSGICESSIRAATKKIIERLYK